MKPLASLGIVLVATLAAGCALAPGMHVEVEPGEVAQVGYQVVPVTATVIREQRVAVSTRAAQVDPNALPVQDSLQAVREYLVGPGDVLSVVVWDHPELTSLASSSSSSSSSERRAPDDGIEVGPDGRMFFPYAGLTLVGGLTVDQIRQLLTERIGVFARAPQVDVRVISHRSQRVQVTGEVVQPGTVALDGTSKGVLEALAERGGLTARASRRVVYLSRGTTRHEIDLDRLYGGQLGSISPSLMPGDVIRVPDSSGDEVVVLGAVEAPRSLPVIGDSLSAISAVAAAGGVSKTSAKGSDLYIFRAPDLRQTEPGPIQVFQIDMTQPQGMVLATNFILLPRDVLYVASTGLSKFNSVMVQLLPTLQEIFYIDRLTDRDR